MGATGPVASLSLMVVGRLGVPGVARLPKMVVARVSVARPLLVLQLVGAGGPVAVSDPGLGSSPTLPGTLPPGTPGSPSRGSWEEIINISFTDKVSLQGQKRTKSGTFSLVPAVV